MKNKDKKIKKKPANKVAVCILLAVSAVIFLGLAWWQRQYLTQGSEYTFSSVSCVAYGQNGNTLLIDNSKKSIILLDADGVVKRRIDGGSLDAPFYYAAYVDEGDDGSIYVADVEYGSRGNLLNRERIIKIQGGKSECLYEADYTEAPVEETPMQYGNIREIKFADGCLYYLYADDKKLTVYSMRPDGTTDPVMSYLLKERINDASYDVSTGNLIISYRNGDFIVVSPDGSTEEVLTGEEKIVWDITAVSGRVCFSELLSAYVGGFDESDPENVEVILGDLGMLYKLDNGSDPDSMLASDQVAFIRVNAGNAEYVETAPISYLYRVVVTWLLLAAGIISALALLAIFVKAYIRLIVESEQAMRVMFIILASVSVAFFISYSLVNDMMNTSTSEGEKRLELFGELLVSLIDPDAIMELDSPDEYHNEDFDTIKTVIDEKTAESYDNGEYYYYVIYRRNGDYLSSIMDYEDTQSILYPVAGYEDEPYHTTITEGEVLSFSENSAYGAWSYVVLPIRDKAGDIVAVLEVGQSLDALNARRGDIIKELVMTVTVCTLVLSMLMLELAFLLGFVEKSRGKDKAVLDPSETVPIRSLMFFSYVADSMQDAFIAVVCTELYKGGLPVPDSVAVALPMSAQLLMMAVASAFSGGITQKLGPKKTLVLGMLTELSGFVLCFSLNSYTGLFIGKLLIGTGMGLIYVCCNTVASMAGSTEKAGEAYAGVSAGTLSGITIGAGLASILLAMGGYRLIYATGIGIVGFGLFIALFSGNPSCKKKNAEDGEEHRIGFAKFMFNRRVLPFFLLLLLPFMMSLSYREYFFPIFASENGFDEVSVGRIYLLCGMVVIYIGPVLSAKLLEKLGAYKSVLLAAAGMLCAMGMFIIYPSVPTVIGSIVVLSLVISFAYTVQYTHFGQLPECDAFGEGSAMSVYSVFESVGQTVGPVAYGVILTFGYRNGITIAAAVLLGLWLLYALIGTGMKKAKTK